MQGYTTASNFNTFSIKVQLWKVHQ
jgi:hypothetical protein